jgi:hypothetical protein
MYKAPIKLGKQTKRLVKAAFLAEFILWPCKNASSKNLCFQF